jgi:hypothetical protein
MTVRILFFRNQSILHFLAKTIFMARTEMRFTHDQKKEEP